MSETNNTTKKKGNQYHHLNYKDRCTIETLASVIDENGKRVYNNTYIANYLGFHRSSISRELRKRIKSKIYVISGKVTNKPYNATDAQNNYIFKRGLSKGEYLLRKYPKMAKFIEEKIKIDKWSPDVIVGWMKSHNYFQKEGFTSITAPTIYNAIRYGIINVKLEDMRRMKYNKEYQYHEKQELPISKQAFSIEKRPEEINNRNVFGHFELDTVISKRDSIHECLLTITERKTRFEMIFRLHSKSSEEVTNKINQLKIFLNKYYNRLIKSYTTDNGSEFSNFVGIIANSKTNIYFCHPYCSGEKGTNEKHNSIIRYFIPKGTLIENFSNKQINKIADWMNNYPRKILDYKTPLECVLDEFNDKAIINKFYKLQEKVNGI